MATFSAASLRNAAPGLGVLAQAIGGNGAYEGARQAEIDLQSKLAQALAQQQAHEATARMNTAKAAGTEARNALMTPDALRRNAMTSYGIPLDEEGAVTNYFQTGDLGGKYQAPVDGIGPVAPPPEWAKNLGEVARSIGGVQTALAIGDKNSENIAKAGAINRNSRLSDAIIAGTANRNTVGGAQAAAAGKALFHSGSDGGVLDQFQGTLDTTNPLAMATIGLKGAQANNQNAGAAAHYASAGKTRLETDQIRNAPKGRFDPVSGMLIDERAGTARPVVGLDGKPIAGRVKELTEGQAKDNGYGSRMMEADSILNKMAGKYSSAAVNARVAADNSVVPGAGMVANWLQSEEGQQVEQAQRDFINAILRRESGAAIAPSEFANATKQYFPQPNDKPENLRQKARNRKIAIEGVFGSVPKDRRGVPSLSSPQGPSAAPTGGGFTYIGKE